MKRIVRLGIGAAIAAVGAGLYWVLAHCTHKYSRPMTMPWSKGKPYVVCLECGAQFDFDPVTLKIGARRESTQ